MKRIAASGRELTGMRGLVSSFEVACVCPNRERGFGVSNAISWVTPDSLIQIAAAFTLTTRLVGVKLRVVMQNVLLSEQSRI